LTLISAAVGALIIFTEQMDEYVRYVSTLDLDGSGGRMPLQIAVHMLAYAITCFVLVATARTISTPVSPERSPFLCRLQVVLEAIFVAVPSVVLVALPAKFIASPPGWLFWATVGVGSAGLAAAVFFCRGQQAFRRFQLSIAALVAGIPTLVLAVLLLLTAIDRKPIPWLLALITVVAAAGLIATVATVVLAKGPLELFRSSLSPLVITKVDALGALALVASATLVASFVVSPVGSATFLGIFPVLFVASATFLIVVSAIFAKGSAPVAILSTLVSVVVVMYALEGALPTREFRYKSEIPPELAAKLTADKSALLEIDEVTKARAIPQMREAFRAWLQVRRPKIEMYRAKGRSYPVFVVAAQGGGIYAAYHSALSLARLYDACPEFADHVFVLSGVSGGSLGSAVFAELVRGLPESVQNKPGAATEGCNPRKDAPRLEDKVKAFFKEDFLSPVLDTAMVFDIPRLIAPVLRFRLDRAYALEYAFEAAWRRAGVDGGAGYGLSAPFYGRWKPDSPAPALVLSTTGVNYGIPVLVSQISWSQVPRLRLRSWKEGRDGEDVKGLLRKLQAQDELTRDTTIADILDFRPDLQVATSTAVALSARFPYVTPPANIKRNDRIKTTSAVFDKIRVLELLDGAYFDNSGGSVAIDIVEDLERLLKWRRHDELLKDIKDDIKFELIRFTDRPAQRYGDANDDEHFELVAPILAFNSVRAARGAQLRGVRDLERTDESFVYLSDPWFLPPLNWVLSEATKREIEVRSFGPKAGAKEVCCRAIAPPRAPTENRRRRSNTSRDILMVAAWEDAKQFNALPGLEGWKVEQFVPSNQETFDKLLRLIKEGDDRIAVQGMDKGKGQAPQPEAPKVDAPKVEAPKVDAAK
jgi:hypothetical protein